MKRLALLSFAAMMLAATAFAPVAMAETGDVVIQSVTKGIGGTAVVTGTIDCYQGYPIQVYAEVLQTTGNKPYNFGNGTYPPDGSGAAICPTSGQNTFTITVLGAKPFKNGAVMVREWHYYCDPFTGCQYSPFSAYEEFRIH
jgi:hypothetical protein